MKMCKSEAMRGYRRSFGRWEYEMIWNFCGTTVSQPKREKKRKEESHKSRYRMEWDEQKKRGVGRTRRREKKNLITQRSKCALCGECRNLCMWKSSLRKKTFYWFSAQWFFARVFSSHLSRRGKIFFPLLLLADAAAATGIFSGSQKKRKISAMVCCRMKKNVQHIVYHVRKRTHIFMKNLYGNSSSSNSNSCTQTVR